MAQKTYFALSNLDYPPNHSIQIGQIISSPSKPWDRLAEPIHVPESTIQRKLKTDWSSEVRKENEQRIGLWAQIAAMILGVGADAEVTWSRKNSEILQFDELETTFFEPDQQYVQASVLGPERESVAQWIKENRGKSVYMITGVKVARGAKHLQARVRGVDFDVKPSIDTTPFTGVPVSGGPHIGAGRMKGDATWEYPLSTLIASEWSSTRYRGTMLAMVFLTQPLAQLAAQGVGLGALRGISKSYDPPLDHTTTDHAVAAPVIDTVWRLVVGVGAAPALLAIIGRLTIPETPRFLLEIERDASAAVQSTAEVYPGPAPKDTTLRSRTASVRTSPTDTAETAEVETSTAHAEPPGEDNGADFGEPSNLKEFYGPARINTEQIIREDDRRRANTMGQQSGNSGDGNAPNPKETLGQWGKRAWGAMSDFLGSKHGPILMAISLCWFLLDICYYGLGLDNPQLLSKIWLAHKPTEGTSPNTPSYDWTSNSLNRTQEQPIFQVLEGNFTRALYTTAPASFLGCLLLLLLVNRLPRVRFMVCIFILLATIFAITGGSLYGVYETSDHDVTVVFYAISMFLINIGPNTIIFMLPAELFETKNRGTCYGIAAASGKLGAMVVQIVMWKIKAGGTKKEPLAILLLFFVPLMLLGALTAWIWIPEVQEPADSKSKGVKQYSKFDNRSLEEIALDPTKDQVVGLRNKLGFGKNI